MTVKWRDITTGRYSLTLPQPALRIASSCGLGVGPVSLVEDRLRVRIKLNLKVISANHQGQAALPKLRATLIRLVNLILKGFDREIKKQLQ
jgi:hypothetical protein